MTRILLGITGSIATGKIPELVRSLRTKGVCVETILTKGAQAFVGTSLLEGLTGNPVHTNLWKEGMPHIRLERESDLLLVAPATAHFLAKLAWGLADDLLSTLSLASTHPLVVAPAMNAQMWKSAAVQANIKTLTERGVVIVPPAEGKLACGEEGVGRLAEIDEILSYVQRALTSQDYEGLRVLVTAGPTREPLDSVRFLSNPSTGTMGAAIATEAWLRGAEVTVVAGPGTPPVPLGVQRLEVVTAGEMATCAGKVPFDIGFFAAAVGDLVFPQPVKGKPRKRDWLESGPPPWSEAPDALESVARRDDAGFVLGFAAHAGGAPQEAANKVFEKGADGVFANDISDKDSGFGTGKNKGILFLKGRDLLIPLSSKREIASRLLDEVIPKRVVIS
ncbi:bifunctional phosphopantothenoylcysteine decarboxylase/phosphopantothenate--cysteine ligase CoaBC [bacterium]|nr:bifunctional phosphopantothenoylcysteine decarboxylase/phosphopantothenate--cysteine ligase CoaBC [bacterium]